MTTKKAAKPRPKGYNLPAIAISRVQHEAIKTRALEQGRKLNDQIRFELFGGKNGHTQN